jgi:hypothetical protein
MAETYGSGARKHPPPIPDKKTDTRNPGGKDASPEPVHADPPPRDVREAPSPHPNGKPVREDIKTPPTNP